ncbi:site-specific integrase [Nocardioides marmoriginsengisoli]|uniref:Site-specific integrase n=1 Tax=Nocardioides marmoriginsengisoli TaxID=661483 RepID=A0A3N0CDD8_9ACTN|nr:tyrosine-type recombinase/integrase [Nocardioides marmoriginsengisoli]RNL61013.1 site-specific integrase [Nocardioides marmoriginsengisoli]
MPTKKRTSGEGSIYQRHDRGCPATVDGPLNERTGKPTQVRPVHKCTGPWVGVLVTGYRDGKPVRKKVSATTRSAAAAKLDELKVRHKGNDLPEGRLLTVEAWLTHWLTQIVPRKAKPKTIVAYTTVVDGYLIPLLGHHRIDRLTPEHIDDAWDHLLEYGNPTLPESKRIPLSPNSVHHAHRVLARALKVALQRKKVKTNVAGSDSMDAPPLVESEIEPIPDEDVTKILAAAADDPYGARWSVALSLGLRPGEALGLRWENVDLAAGVLLVKEQLQRQAGKGLVLTAPKSASGVRSMVLPKTMLTALKAHKKLQSQARLAAGDQWHDSGLVFTLPNGKGVDSKVDGERWHRLLDKAEVKQRRLYDARHSAATLMLAQGVELRVAMALLGHSQVSVTMKYQHAVDKLKHDAAEKMEAGMWGQAKPTKQ